MVRTSAQRAATTVIEGIQGCTHCPADRSKRPLNQSLRPGKSNTSHCRRRESALHKPTNIGWVVGQIKHFQVGQRGAFDLKLTLQFQQLSHHAVFVDWELVPVW